MTFLVCGNFVENAQLLDMQRVAKQRAEGRQILAAIQYLNEGRTDRRGWINHPIVRAWRYYPHALQYYINCMILEFIRRGGDNHLPLYDLPPVILMPWWATWDRLHQSHRAMLMRKDPFYYADKFTITPEYTLHGYIWPEAALYDNREAPLAEITAPIPPTLIDPVYCRATLKSGANKGTPCHRLVKDKQPLCAIHRKSKQK